MACSSKGFLAVSNGVKAGPGSVSPTSDAFNLDPSLPINLSCFRSHAVLCGSALTFCAPDQVYVAKPNARKKLVRGKPLGRYYEMLVTQEQELSGAAKRKGHEGNGGEKIDLENFEKDGQERRRINSPTSVGLFCFCDGLSVSLSFSLSPLSFLPTSQVRRCDCPRVSFVGTVGSELNRQVQVS